MTIGIQCCDECGALNYPSRALCRVCLGDSLVEQDDPGAGVLLAAATLHRSFEPAYADLLPIRVGTVVLDSGPRLMSFIDEEAVVGDRVRIRRGSNPTGEAVWIADPE